MTRTIQQIVDHAEDLARQFEDYRPSPDDERDSGPYNDLRQAVHDRAKAEASIADAVLRARAARYSWATIGALLGTTGQAASQRYGRITQTM